MGRHKIERCYGTTQSKVGKGVAHKHIHAHRQSVKCLKNEALKSLASALLCILRIRCVVRLDTPWLGIISPAHIVNDMQLLAL